MVGVEAEVAAVAPALAVEAEEEVVEAAALALAAQALVRVPEGEAEQVPEPEQVRVREQVLDLVLVRAPEEVAVAEGHRRCRQYEPFERSASGGSRRLALDLSAPVDRSPACGQYRSKVPGLAAARSPLPLQATTWREAISD